MFLRNEGIMPSHLPPTPCFEMTDGQALCECHFCSSPIRHACSPAFHGSWSQQLDPKLPVNRDLPGPVLRPQCLGQARLVHSRVPIDLKVNRINNGKTLIKVTVCIDWSCENAFITFGNPLSN